MQKTWKSNRICTCGYIHEYEDCQHSDGGVLRTIQKIRIVVIKLVYDDDTNGVIFAYYITVKFSNNI